MHKWHAKGVGLIDITILLYAKENACQLWTIDKKLLAIMEGGDAFLNSWWKDKSENRIKSKAK